MDFFVFWIVSVAVEVVYMVCLVSRGARPRARLQCQPARLVTRDLKLVATASSMGLDCSDGRTFDIPEALGVRRRTGRTVQIASLCNTATGLWKGIHMLSADCLLRTQQVHQTLQPCTVFFVKHNAVMPAFSLFPALGQQPLERHFPASFSSLYSLEAPSPQDACSALRPDVQAWLEAFPGWFVQSDGSWLVLHRDTLVPPETFAQVFNEAWMLCDLLRLNDGLSVPIGFETRSLGSLTRTAAA